MNRHARGDYKRRKIAIEQALKVLGEPTKTLLLSHLKENGVVLESSYCSPMDVIKNELQKIIGEGGASLIMRLISEIELGAMINSISQNDPITQHDDNDRASEE